MTVGVAIRGKPPGLAIPRALMHLLGYFLDLEIGTEIRELNRGVWSVLNWPVPCLDMM